MELELRCRGKKHAMITPEWIEIKCNSRLCGASSGVVVLHRYNYQGDLVETIKFREPAERKANATDRGAASVRSA